MKMFSYTKGTDEFNDLIEEVVAFAAADLEGKALTDREARVKELNAGIIKYCAADTRVQSIFEAKGLDAVKDPRFTRNTDFQENFNAVIAQIVNPILPMVANKDFVRFLANVHQVGYGDTARFIVKSNELYKVNEIASGINRGILQPIHNNEVTVNASPIEIATEIDWHQVAAGAFDFGDFGLRAARSFEQYIFLKVIAALTAGVSNLGPAYSATGFTNANWSTLAQRVSAANGNSDVFAIGTLTALNSIVPSQAGLQYGLGQKIVEQGYLDRYLGTRLVVLDQVFGYGEANTNGAFALADDLIYFLPVAGNAPVHIVYEGDSVVVDREPTHTSDLTYRVRIQERVGVAAVVGSKFACLDLEA